jgi:hypothetical protein
VRRGAAGSRRHALAIGTLALVALLAPREAAASTEPQDSVKSPPTALMRTRLYFGMWSTHLRDLNGGLDGTALIGVALRGFYGATFINSFGDRAVAAGIQRGVTSPGRGALTTALGYRVGLITGYDERFFGIGDKAPALPFAQLVGSLDYRNLGVELAYAGIVASVVLNWRI